VSVAPQQLSFWGFFITGLDNDHLARGPTAIDQPIPRQDTLVIFWSAGKNTVCIYRNNTSTTYWVAITLTRVRVGRKTNISSVEKRLFFCSSDSTVVYTIMKEPRAPARCLGECTPCSFSQVSVAAL
jgi:hypothetical protein